MMLKKKKIKFVENYLSSSSFHGQRRTVIIYTNSRGQNNVHRIIYCVRKRLYLNAI